MKFALISITEQGRRLSEKLSADLSGLHQIRRYCYQKHSDQNADSFQHLSDLTEQIFHQYQGIIFICACGIAVRAIAPHIQSKNSDPAVLVCDDSGKFVISLLSGHLGGANALTEQIALHLNAIPVITTATDIRKNFSPDAFAKANDLLLEDLHSAKEIASAVLHGEEIGFVSDYADQNRPEILKEDTSCRTGICISSDIQKKPFPVTLNLIPKNLVLGIGCKKNIHPEIFEQQILQFLADTLIPLDRISAVASIDLKKSESALLNFCEKYRYPLFFYSAQELMEVQGEFSASAFVKQITGTDNVCERSAVRCSHGRLILPKHSGNGITIAIAEKQILIDFERSPSL